MPSPLNLLHLLDGQAMHENERVFISKLALLSSYLFGVYVSTATAHAVSSPGAADIEYASWLPDPGALEVASWTPISGVRCGECLPV